MSRKGVKQIDTQHKLRVEKVDSLVLPRVVTLQVNSVKDVLHKYMDDSSQQNCILSRVIIHFLSNHIC